MPNNQILRALPTEEFVELQRHLSPAPLLHRGILHGVNEPIQHVYFIESGMVSLIVLSHNGDGIETGTVGSDGVIGCLVAIGTEAAPVQAAVQIAGQAFRCTTPAFLNAYSSLPTLRAMVNKHIGNLLMQAEQNTLCHALHSVEARLCRWMLQTQDLVHSNSFELTQEFLSNMLGVQRTSVSITAHTLQRSGFIRYRRGRIEILNRQGLEEGACECYRVLNKKRIASEEPVAPMAASSSR
jgi:CRP-like cAMP-binding protein